MPAIMYFHSFLFPIFCCAENICKVRKCVCVPATAGPVSLFGTVLKLHKVKHALQNYWCNFNWTSRKFICVSLQAMKN